MKEIYCDGSCLGNPGPGGWGVLVKDGDLKAEIYAHESKTTNNKMELMAAITAVKFVKKNEKVTIYTDSKYVITGITEWIKGWKKNNWLTSKKEAVKNSDLWKELDKLSQYKELSWVWVKAHNGNEGNEIVDSLAKMGASGKSNIHMLDDLIAKFIILEQKIIKNEMINDKFPLYSIVMSENEKYLVIDDQAIIYPKVSAYIFKSISKIGGIQSIDKEKAHKYFIKLNEENSYKIGLAMLNEVQSQHQEVYYKYKMICSHQIIKKHDSAVCDKCNSGFGWYCTDSPDNTCHYYTTDGNVNLNNGKVVSAPVGHNSLYESNDCCVFCGAPEERK